MSVTPERLRGELLFAVWQTGPLDARRLLRLGAEHGATGIQVDTALALLCWQGLVFMDDAGPGPACYGPALDAEEEARREYARLSGQRACRVCGCSDIWACDEGCWWAESELCTSCVEPDGRATLGLRVEA